MKTHLLSFVMLWFAAGAAFAESLDVATAVAEALQNNPDLVTLRARRDQAQAGAGLAEANRNPNLRLFATVNQYTDDNRVRPASANNQEGVFSDQIWRGGLEASWTLYSGGRLSAVVDAERLLAKAAGKDVNFFQQQLAASVARLGYELAARDALIQASTTSLESLRGQEKRVEQLQAQGKAAEVDRLRIQVRAASVEQTLIQQQNERDTLRRELNFLMGRDLEAVWTFAEADQQPDSTRVTTLLKEAWPARPRPDLQALALRDQAAERSVRAANASLRPEVNLVGSWGPAGDVEGEETFESGFVGLVAKWDLWDGNRRSQRVAQARAAQEEVQARRNSSEEQRRLEQLTARQNVRSTLSRLNVARLSTDTARESLRIEKVKYNEGKGTILDVLDAEAASLEAESLRQRALADLRIRMVEWDLALGQILTDHAFCFCLKPLESAHE